MRILSGGSYVQINRAELADGGRYTCVANNIAGRTTRRFQLAVQGEPSRAVSFALCGRWRDCLSAPVFSVAPSIREGSQTVSAPVNASAVLECVANGVPPPEVTWRKGGALLADEPR